MEQHFTHLTAYTERITNKQKGNKFQGEEPKKKKSYLWGGRIRNVDNQRTAASTSSVLFPCIVLLIVYLVQQHTVQGPALMDLVSVMNSTYCGIFFFLPTVKQNINKSTLKECNC